MLFFPRFRYFFIEILDFQTTKWTVNSVPRKWSPRPRPRNIRKTDLLDPNRFGKHVATCVSNRAVNRMKRDSVSFRETEKGKAYPRFIRLNRGSKTLQYLERCHFQELLWILFAKLAFPNFYLSNFLVFFFTIFLPNLPIIDIFQSVFIISYSIFWK